MVPLLVDLSFSRTSLPTVAESTPNNPEQRPEVMPRASLAWEWKTGRNTGFVSTCGEHNGERTGLSDMQEEKIWVTSKLMSELLNRNLRKCKRNSPRTKGKPLLLRKQTREQEMVLVKVSLHREQQVQ